MKLVLVNSGRDLKVNGGLASLELIRKTKTEERSTVMYEGDACRV